MGSEQDATPASSQAPECDRQPGEAELKREHHSSPLIHPVTRDSLMIPIRYLWRETCAWQVDNSTSQEQILRMYKLGHEIPWDVRKPQPVPPPF
jgi:hypothetical protein